MEANCTSTLVRGKKTLKIERDYRKHWDSSFTFESTFQRTRMLSLHRRQKDCARVFVSINENRGKAKEFVDIKSELIRLSLLVL